MLKITRFSTRAVIGSHIQPAHHPTFSGITPSRSSSPIPHRHSEKHRLLTAILLFPSHSLPYYRFTLTAMVLQDLGRRINAAVSNLTHNNNLDEKVSYHR